METIGAVLSENLNITQPTSTKVCEKHGCEISEYGFSFKGKLYQSGKRGCKKCYAEEFEAERAEEVAAQNNAHKAKIVSGDFMEIPRRFKGASLADFKVDYSYSFDGSVFITGSCGTGKTHLAVALTKFALLETGHHSDNMRFYNFQELSIKIKSSFREDGASMHSIIEECLGGFIILDDIGTSKPSETSIEALYTIVNSRYENVLPTIYTTNLSLGELANVYGDRIASRLSSCKKINLVGKDFRLEGK